MQKRQTVSRRSVLTTAGVTALAAVAGCSGDGDGEGENSDRTSTAGVEDNDDGTEATETDTSVTQTEQEIPEPKGEQVDSFTITDTNMEWEYELEQGDTITAIGTTEGEKTRISGTLSGPEAVERITNVGRGGMQMTAEENGTHTVFMGTDGTLTVDIYIDR